MSKKVYANTSAGKKLYVIDEVRDRFICYKTGGTIFSEKELVGRASSLQDALSLIKSHALIYGTVKSIDFN